MGKKSKAKRAAARNAFNSAPMQGMDGVMNETFNDYSAITIPTGVTGLVTIRAAYDVNGFSWTVTQGGSFVSQSSPPSVFNQEFYGDNNKLFQYWANLFAQYRINSIMATVEPVASGGVISASPVINVIDEDNVLGVRGQSYGDLLPNLGFMRTGKLDSPQRPVHRSLSYQKWLGQTTEEAWRQTQDPNPPTGTTLGLVREPYPTQAAAAGSQFTKYPVKNLPAVVMVFGLNIAANTGGILAGVLHVKSHFSFRLRNLIPGSLQVTPRSEADKDVPEDLTESTRSKLANVLKALS